MSLNEFGVFDVSQPPVLPSGQYVVSVTLPQEPFEALLMSIWTHPVVALHESVVHGFPSLQRLLFGVPWQAPAAQTSFVVQVIPSLHEAVLFTCVQVPSPLQVSVVHTLLSSQLYAVPAHVPPPHTSFLVQAFPSLHGKVLFMWLQVPSPVEDSAVLQLLSYLLYRLLPQLPLPHTS